MIYTLYGYSDLDGAIATAIALRHLRDLVQKYENCVVEFDVEPVPYISNKKKCLSGFVRENYRQFGFSKELISSYDNFIDMAEIDFHTSKSWTPRSSRGVTHRASICHPAARPRGPTHFSSPVFKMKSLLYTTHPCINKRMLYKTVVNQIYLNPSVEDFFDSDFLSNGVVH